MAAAAKKEQKSGIKRTGRISVFPILPSIEISPSSRMPQQIEKKIRDMRKMMEKAAKELDFMQAAKLRDDIKALQEKL